MTGLTEWEREALDAILVALSQVESEKGYDFCAEKVYAAVGRFMATRFDVMGRELLERERFALEAANAAADAGKRTTYIRHSTEAYAYADAQLVVKKGGLVG